MGLVRFEFGGRELTLPEVTQDDKRELAAVGAACAVMAARAMAKYLPPPEAAEELAETQRLARAGHFAWEEPGGWTYRHTEEGVIRLVHLCLNRRPGQRVALDDVRAMAAVDGGKWLADLYRQANPDPLAAPPPPSGGASSAPDSPSATASSTPAG